jgi:hypothetical protein
LCPLCTEHIVEFIESLSYGRENGSGDFFDGGVCAFAGCGHPEEASVVGVDDALIGGCDVNAIVRCAVTLSSVRYDCKGGLGEKVKGYLHHYIHVRRGSHSILYMDLGVRVVVGRSSGNRGLGL